jgi:tetratricopeptide (TPR) repeat protein
MKKRLSIFSKSTACAWILILILSAFVSCGLKDVAYYHNLGVKAEREGNMNEARSAYLEALKLDAEHAPSLYNLGNVFFYQRNWKDARENYIRGLIENTNHAAAWCNLGMVYLQLKEREKAYLCFTYAWDLDPTMTQALISHAAALVEEGKEGEAIKILEKGSRSEDGRVFFNLGLLQYEAGAYENALKSFERAAELSPEELRVQIKLCRTFIRLDRQAEALAVLEAVRTLDVMGWQVDLLKAELDFMNNRLTDAETALRAHLDLFPDSYAGLLILGEIASRRGQHESAHRHFARAAAVDFTRKEAAIREVDTLFVLSRFDEARDRLSILSRSFPEDVRVLEGLMRIHFRQGYYDKAAGNGEKLLVATLPREKRDEVQIITGMSHIMNEDISKRNLTRGIELLWPHRNAEPRNRLLLRYLHGALVEQKEDARAAEVRRLM